MDTWILWDQTNSFRQKIHDFFGRRKVTGGIARQRHQNEKGKAPRLKFVDKQISGCYLDTLPKFNIASEKLPFQ